MYFQSLPFNWALSAFLLQNEDAKEKKTTPGEKVHKVNEKTNQTKGPEVARKDEASAVTVSHKDKKEQRKKPVDKIKER